MPHVNKDVQNVVGTNNRQTRLTRQFDATVGAITAKEPVSDELTEDLGLTDVLTRSWLDLVNLQPTPLPRCPHCDGLRIRPDRNKGGNLPSFFCHGCKRSFNRLTGTPFAHLVKPRERRSDDPAAVAPDVTGSGM